MEEEQLTDSELCWRAIRLAKELLSNSGFAYILTRIDPNEEPKVLTIRQTLELLASSPRNDKAQTSERLDTAYSDLVCIMQNWRKMHTLNISPDSYAYTENSKPSEWENKMGRLRAVLYDRVHHPSWSERHPYLSPKNWIGCIGIILLLFVMGSLAN